MLALIVGFFGICIAYVAWCDRIIGPDDADLRSDNDDSDADDSRADDSGADDGALAARRNTAGNTVTA